MLYGAQRMQRTQRLLILLDHLLDAVLRAVHPNWRVTRRRARCGQQKRVGSGEESEQRKQARHVYEIASETGRPAAALSWRSRAAASSQTANRCRLTTAGLALQTRANKKQQQIYRS